MTIRPNRVKQKLAAGQVATILSGTNDPDLIDQLGPLGPEGIACLAITVGTQPAGGVTPSVPRPYSSSIVTRAFPPPRAPSTP